MIDEIWNHIASGTANALEITTLVVAILICIIGIVALIVSIYLSIKYVKFNKQKNSAQLTGEEVARKLLDKNGLNHIKIKVSGSLLFGNSYSHYFKKIRLRRFTTKKKSLTSLAMGAQKASLAVLDKENNAEMKRRIRLYPLIVFGPYAFVPLILIGLLIEMLVINTNGLIAIGFCVLALVFYILSIVLSVATLKTEKLAQEKAYEILKKENLATDEEIAQMKELFRLYNIQYINNIILSTLELIYYILQIILNYSSSSSK